MTVSERLAELGIELPTPPAPVGGYVPAVRHGTLVVTTGQLPFRDGELVATGRLGEELDVPACVAAARQSALNAVAAAAAVAGGVDRLQRALELVAHVAVVPGSDGLSAVVDGASSVLTEVFGEAGRHVRTNVGVAWLPLGSPVEVRLTFAVAEPS